MMMKITIIKVGKNLPKKSLKTTIPITANPKMTIKSKILSKTIYHFFLTNIF